MQQRFRYFLYVCLPSYLLALKQGSVWTFQPEQSSRRIRTSEWTRWGRRKTIRVECVHRAAASAAATVGLIVMFRWFFLLPL